MDLKEKLLKAVEQCVDKPDSCDGCPYKEKDGVESYICDLEQLLRDVRGLIKRQETKMGEEQKETGHWIIEERITESYRCSACEGFMETVYRGMNYCPYCGTEMNGTKRT